MYDTCISKLENYYSDINEIEKMSYKEHAAWLNNLKSNVVVDEFQNKLFLKLIENHRLIHEKYKKKIISENIVELTVSPLDINWKNEV